MSKTRKLVGGVYVTTVTKKSKGGKKNRKHGRNKTKCEIYRNEDRRNKNKRKKLDRIARRLAKRSAKLNKA